MTNNENIPVVRLPLHDIPDTTQYCYRCGEEMSLCTATMMYKYKGQKVTVSNIRLHRCRKCRENVYTSEEAETIENALRSAVGE